jgi:hypothetical protein
MEPHFGALLPLGHRVFKLHMTVVVNFWSHFEVDARRLPAISTELESVIADFEAKGSKVTVEFGFLLASKEPFSDSDRLDWALSTGLKRVRVISDWCGRSKFTDLYTEFDAIKDKDAKKMLTATAKQRAQYFIDEVGFDQAIILEKP